MLRSLLNKLQVQRRSLALMRRFSTQKLSSSKNASTINSNVEGLSQKCVKIPSKPVGPGAAKDKQYKNPEYFCYHIDTFGEAEVELAKYRLPVPSNKVPFNK